MAKEENADRKVRGRCRTCGRGVHLWERFASPHGVGDKPIEEGWDHDKDEDKSDHAAEPV